MLRDLGDGTLNCAVERNNAACCFGLLGNLRFQLLDFGLHFTVFFFQLIDLLDEPHLVHGLDFFGRVLLHAVILFHGRLIVFNNGGIVLLLGRGIVIFPSLLVISTSLFCWGWSFFSMSQTFTLPRLNLLRTSTSFRFPSFSSRTVTFFPLSSQKKPALQALFSESGPQLLS